MRLITTLFLTTTVVFAGGASDPSAGACAILPAAAIQKVFGEVVTNAKPAAQTTGELKHSQCFYSLPTFTNSISVSMTAANPASVHRDAARELWQRWFHAEGDGDRDAPGTSEEKEEAAKASPLPNLGDEAFWVHSFVGNLYVLKGNTVLRISIGGKLSDEERQKRARVLAVAALKNLKSTR